MSEAVRAAKGRVTTTEKKLLVYQSQSFCPHEWPENTYLSIPNPAVMNEALADAIFWMSRMVRESKFRGVPTRIDVKLETNNLDAQWVLVFWGEE